MLLSQEALAAAAAAVEEGSAAAARVTAAVSAAQLPVRIQDLDPQRDSLPQNLPPTPDS